MVASESQLENPKSMTLDKSADRVRQMFAEIAPRYDFLNHFLSLNIDRWWRSRTIKLLNLATDQPVLDVCTGTGDLAFGIAKRLDRSTKLEATDFCSEMLDIARKKQSKQSSNACPVRFQEADTQSLPFGDDSFQAVTVAFGLRNVADPLDGLREMRRVCRPGGKVAVLEFSPPSTLGLKQLYQFYFRSVLPRIGNTLAKNSSQAYAYLPSSVSQFPSGREFASMMLKAGLNKIQIRPMTFGVVSLYVGHK